MSRNVYRGNGFDIDLEPCTSCPRSFQDKYNGKSWEDELGLNIYAMDMRQFDPAIARWVVQDPVIHHNQSQYNGFDGNPIFWADPIGADANTSLGSDLNGNRRYNSYGLFMPMTERGVRNHMEARAIANGGKVTSSDSSGSWVKYFLENNTIIEKKDNGDSTLEGFILVPIYDFMFIENDLSKLFDKQLFKTHQFFSKENAKLNSMTLFPGTKLVTRMVYFTQMVKTGADYDLKNHGYSEKNIGQLSIYHGQIFTHDYYGNYNYGVAAKAYGIPLEMAILGAGLNQMSKFEGSINNPRGWFDYPRDTQMIINGYNAK